MGATDLRQINSNHVYSQLIMINLIDLILNISNAVQFRLNNNSKVVFPLYFFENI